jgi:hypothetical protein
VWLFVGFLALFWLATAPARSVALKKEMRFDPIRVYRTIILTIGVLWLLPLSQIDPLTDYTYFGLYYLAAAASIWGWVLGTHRVTGRIQIGINETTLLGTLFALSLPFVVIYPLSGNLFDDFRAITQSSALELRQLHWENFNQRSLLDNLVQLSSYAALPFSFYWTTARRKGLAFWYSICLFALCLIPGITDASRTGLVFFVAVAVMILYRQRGISLRDLAKRHPFMAIVALAIVAFAIYYLTFVFLLQKAPGLSFEYYRVYVNIAGAPPSSLLLDMNSATGGTIGVFAASLSYFTSTLTFFEAFLRDASSCGCTEQWGAYNFSILDLLGITDWNAIRASIARFWEMRQAGVNPWASSYRDWFIDFGYFGTIIFGFALFYFFGSAVRSSSSRVDSISVITCTYVAIMIQIVPMLSPLLSTAFFVPLVMLLFFSKFSFRKRHVVDPGFERASFVQSGLEFAK